MFEKIENKIKSELKINCDDLKKIFGFRDVVDFIKNEDYGVDIKLSINNFFYFVDNKTYFFGKLRVAEKGFGFAINSDETVEDAFVPPNALSGAINNDNVIYKLEKEKDGRFKAEIIDTIDRPKAELVGKIKRAGKDNQFLDFVSNEQSFKNYFFVMINKNEYKLKEGMLLKVKIIRVENRKMFVRILKTLGSYDKPEDRIISIAYEFGIEPDFPQEVLDQANIVAKPIDYSDPLVSRRKNDLRNLCLVTIDGVDSKDLDDSICVIKNDNGYKMYVAIADVSYYVRPKTPLDISALNKGNSVYLVNKVLPMLPKILSDGVCSLNPKEEKLCMVCEMDYDNQGVLQNKKVYESIMISKARLNYKQVNHFFETNEINEGTEVQEVLLNSLELHKLIENLKEQKGVIDFEIKEPKIIMSDDSKVIDIEERSSGISERLIENFMVAANESVATIIFEKELPFVYRNHDKPKKEDIVNWMANLKLLGVKIETHFTSDEITSKEVRQVLKEIDKAISDEKEKEILNITLLQHMAKAKYEIENIGHFGLASNCYTHFTSPIRRYSDLMVHRYLRQYIIEKDLAQDKLDQNTKYIDKATKIINETEKQGVDAEREVNKVCMTEYLSTKVGQEYDGYVSAVLKFGLFIQIEKCIEGLVHISNLPDFTYDDQKNIFVNKNNMIYKIGQKVRVRLINADVQKRVIDFELV